LVVVLAFDLGLSWFGII